MGLATSQVRLLALTSRKADVEMQIQLNSKRKTMLTREATELSKLYYAKLQNSKIQYATTNGYKDISYSYLMGQSSSTFFDSVVNATANDDKKASDSMILTDTYGRVILSDDLLKTVLAVMNKTSSPDGSGLPDDKGVITKPRTVETLTIDAMYELLVGAQGGENSSFTGASTTANDMLKQFAQIYDGTAFQTSPTANDQNPTLGMDVLKTILRNGYSNGGPVYRKGTQYYSNPKCSSGDEVTLQQGTFYIVRDANTTGLTYLTATDGSMYWPDASTADSNGFIPVLTGTVAKQVSNMMSYYGAIFSATFSGSSELTGGGYINTYNGSAKLTKNADGKYEVAQNDTYQNLIQGDNLQNGLKSGLYQLVNVSSNSTGGYAKAQGLDYFKTQNLVVEKTDSSERETITAWFNAARADLDEKESYWDTEITSLSSELNTITTEIDSVKKLREDAITSTFKWGGA